MIKKLLSIFLVCFSMMVQSQNFWTETNPFPAHPDHFVMSISVVDEDIVWVCGENTTNPDDAFRASVSLDGGLTWTDRVINLQDLNRKVSNIHAVSATTAYAAIYSLNPVVQGGIYITTDAGLTWTKQQTALYNNIIESSADFVHFFNAQNGVAVGEAADGYFEIYTTSNGGANWNRIPAANISEPFVGEKLYRAAHYDASGNSIWFATNKGHIFKSADNGYNWSRTQSPLSDFGIPDTHFAFKTPNDGLMVTEGRFTEYYISNDGALWDLDFSPTLSRTANIVNVPQTSGTYFCWGNDAVLSPGGIYTTDNGLSWLPMEEEMAPTKTARFFNSQTGYCTGFYLTNPLDLRFFRLDDPLNRMLGSNPFETPAFTVSPNPADTFFNITATTTITSVLLSDVTGKTIRTGQYNNTEAQVDVSALQTGIYFAKVTTDSGMQTLKIIKK